MGKSEKRKNKNVCQANANPVKAALTKQQVSNKLLSDNLHDYLESEMDCADIMPPEVGESGVSCHTGKLSHCS